MNTQQNEDWLYQPGRTPTFQAFLDAIPAQDTWAYTKLLRKEERERETQNTAQT